MQMSEGKKGTNDGNESERWMKENMRGKKTAQQVAAGVVGGEKVKNKGIRENRIRNFRKR